MKFINGLFALLFIVATIVFAVPAVFAFITGALLIVPSLWRRARASNRRANRVREMENDMKPTLYTSEQVAAKLGVSIRRVQALAKSRKVGQRIGVQTLFTPADLVALTPLPPGRPKKHPSVAQD